MAPEITKRAFAICERLIIVTSFTCASNVIAFVVFNAVPQWFPTSGRDPNQGRGGSDVGSGEGFMENAIIMKKNQNLLSKLK